LKASKLSAEEIAYLSTHRQTPVWTEYHIRKTADALSVKKTDWLSEKQKTVIEEECRKLDAFCEILCTSKANHITAEKKAFGITGDFYVQCEKLVNEWNDQKAKERKKQERLAAKTKAEAEKIRKAKEEDEKRAVLDKDANLFLEKGLSKKQRDELMSRDFKRLKISPFGDTGAAFYWVKTHWHESKEHAFFCNIIEAELKKYTKDVQVNIFDSPDVQFGFRHHGYCFEIETGEILKRDVEYLARKFRQLEKDFAKVYILVTNKKLKYKYTKYGEVVTRGTLRKTIRQFFRARTPEKQSEV